MTYDENQLNIMAALMARSNLGFSRPGTGPGEGPELLQRIRNLKASSVVTFQMTVGWMLDEMSESDEHDAIFLEEAEMWRQTLRDMPETEARTTWPWVFEAYESVK